MTQDDQTIAVYDEQASAYATFTASSSVDPALARFMERLPQGGSVLDLGCGPGDQSAAMNAAGFNVTATDASAAMVKLARKHEGIEVRHATFEYLREIETYDGVWANFSLLHAPRAEFPKHLDRVAEALKIGGVFHIGMKTGSDEHRDSIGRHYAYYSAEELKQLLNQRGLSVDSEFTGKSKGLAGDIEPWILLLAHKEQQPNYSD